MVASGELVDVFAEDRLAHAAGQFIFQRWRRGVPSLGRWRRLFGSRDRSAISRAGPHVPSRCWPRNGRSRTLPGERLAAPACREHQPEEGDRCPPGRSPSRSDPIPHVHRRRWSELVVEATDLRIERALQRLAAVRDSYDGVRSIVREAGLVELMIGIHGHHQRVVPGGNPA